MMTPRAVFDKLMIRCNKCLFPLLSDVQIPPRAIAQLLSTIYQDVPFECHQNYTPAGDFPVHIEVDTPVRCFAAWSGLAKCNRTMQEKIGEKVSYFGIF